MTAGTDRRGFLHLTTAAGAAWALSPSILAQATAVGAEPINLGLIGAGIQGETLIDACVKMGTDSGIRFKAVCDIWEELTLNRVVGLLERYGHEVRGYVDYRDLLDAERDLDAVLIATPDFWHAEQTIACLKAGLHVYCEAPMSNRVEGARQMVQAARETGKLLQIGCQRRSNPRYIHCCDKLLRTAGLLGRVSAVNGQWNLPARSDRGWSKRRVLDPAMLEKYGYRSMHHLRNWMWYESSGGGPVVTFGVHQVDVFDWFLQATPKSVTARGGTYYYDRDTHERYDTVMAVLEYETEKGPLLAQYQMIASNGYGGSFEAFLGDEGSLELSESAGRGGVYRDPAAPDWTKWVRLGFLRSPEVSAEEAAASVGLEAHQTQPPARYDLPVVVDVPYHQPHLANFFEAIRGHVPLNCSAESALRATVTVLKINEAVASERTLSISPRSSPSKGADDEGCEPT